MKAVTFMYHDIVAEGADDSSGFPGQAADDYKLSVESFEQHLAAIAAAALASPAVVTEGGTARATYITFDDGGRGSYRNAAPALERRNWRGHFLIATDYINQPPFLSADEIRDLHRRGHIIGSHSASHPLRMARCSRTELRSEWTRSIERLSDIIGAAVTVASVPGGMYSAAVAEEAENAGIRYLFNSEPITRARKLGSCTVLGRFTVKRGTSAGYVRSLARADRMARLRELAWWNFRKSAKALGGELYWRYRRNR